MRKTDLKKSSRDGENLSLWQTVQLLNDSSEKRKDSGKVYDVLIIGGGITGLTTALNLQRLGKSCLLVEGRNLGFGTAGGTSAHLNTFFDSTYPEIDSDFGKEASKLLANAAKGIIEKIKSNVDALGIDADFDYKDGYLFSQNDKESQQLEEIFLASQNAGVAVEKTDTNGLNISYQKSIKFLGQAQFHPLKYIIGLAKEFTRLGGIIQEETFVTGAERTGDFHVAATSAGNIKARNIVWATHIPPGINLLSLRNAPYRSYVLAVKLNNSDYPDCLSYDMKEPYHYFRSHYIDGQPHLLIGGADHKTGHDDAEQAFAELENYAKKNFDLASVAYKWSSQYYVPVDGLPYIGHLPGGEKGIYVATGFNGNGMISGSLSGEIICDLIIGKENELSKLLSPSRIKPVSGFSEFVKENADVAYHFVADRFGVELIESLNELPPGEGKVVEFNGEKVAVYRDYTGKVTALRPVCTHAGCIVSWNAAEKSWDCPCHGGRFSVDGTVLTGPPSAPLKLLDI